MKVSIILPTPGASPIGGIKVVYEYANRLAKNGHDVSVYHVLPTATRRRGFLYSSFSYCARFFGFLGGVSPKGWIFVEPRIKVKWIPCIRSFFIRKSDVLFLTSWRTAEAVQTFSSDKGKKVYFIQDYEFYKSANAEIKCRMKKTYTLGYVNVVISPACREMVEESGGVVDHLVPNGLDHDVLKLIQSIDDPLRAYIGFPYRAELFKRSSDAIEALTVVKNSFLERDLRFWTFGRNKPVDFPDWIVFVESPSDSELVSWYNKTRIFVVPSEYEGWGLPGSEAMSCGAALVSTSNGGVDAYATDKVDALIVPPRSPELLAGAVKYLILNDEFRKNLAQKGSARVRALTWESSSEKMEEVLCASR